jgi:acyl-coenzyme A synthetase/AMP-(fatty) acid ligase
MALVELMPGVTESVCKEIYHYCHENLEERGRPVAVLAVDKLPLTPMGKIDYRALDKEYGKYEYTKWKP